MRRWWSLLFVPVLAGLVLVAPSWRAPGGAAPATRFTDGHLLGTAVWGEAVLRGELPALRTAIQWPNGADFRPLMWPTALIEPLFGPALALTLTFALTPAFNAFAGWSLAAALGLGFPARAVLAAALALNPWVVETLYNGQVEQAVIGGAALQLAVAIRGLRRPYLLPLAGVTTLLVGLAAPHVALAGAVLVGLWSAAQVGWPIAEEGTTVRRRALMALAVVAVTAVACLMVQRYHGSAFTAGAHVFSPKGSGGRPTSISDLPEYASFKRLFWPPPSTGAPVVHPNWLGLTPVVLALWAGWRARVGRLALLCAGGLVVLSLGPTLEGTDVPLPWAALVAVAPNVGQSLSAYRMVAGAVVALAIACACAVDSIPWRYAWVPVSFFLLLDGPVGATRPLPIAAQVVRSDGARAALAQGRGPVLDLPLAGAECPGGVGHYLLEAAATGRPVPLHLANARSGYAAVPGMVGDVVRAVASQQCSERLSSALDRWPFTTVVLHEHAECPVSDRLRDCLSASLGPGTRAGEVTWWDL